MRVSKDPEIRKQEIIDVAMQVFAEKGYESTTMKDIAKAADVVPGLCYHYFKNKHQLYETAVTQYAKECSEPFIKLFNQTNLSLEEISIKLKKVMKEEDLNYKYKKFFDKCGNEIFHKQLEFYMGKEMETSMKKYIQCMMDRGEFQVDNVDLFTKFFIGGQMAVINCYEEDLDNKIAFLRTMLSAFSK
ncbi:TetR/AcrR family transcriptional regulator [Intestinibacter sp.]